MLRFNSVNYSFTAIGEGAVLYPKRGYPNSLSIVALNPTATLILEGLDLGMTVKEVGELMAQFFTLPLPEVEQDIDACLANLIELEVLVDE